MTLVYLSSKREAAIKDNVPWERIEGRIRELVWRFNQVKGMATTSSCAGHVTPMGSGAFRIDEANITLFVTRKRLLQLLRLAPECDILDVSIRYFDDRTFWLSLSWPPETNSPGYKLTRILLGEEDSPDDQ